MRKHSTVVNRFVLFCDNFSERLVGLDHNIEQQRIADMFLRGRGCFCRLRMFDSGWQKSNGFTDPIVSLDLDLVITGPLDDLFARDDDFTILKGANAVNPNPFNASVMMLKPGVRPDVWSEFSLARAEAIPFHEFPDDQGWIWHMVPAAAVWKVGHKSGIYAFEKPGWPANGSKHLPDDARIVAFIGSRKPWQYASLPWMKTHWEAAA